MSFNVEKEKEKIARVAHHFFLFFCFLILSEKKIDLIRKKKIEGKLSCSRDKSAQKKKKQGDRSDKRREGPQLIRVRLSRSIRRNNYNRKI